MKAWPPIASPGRNRESRSLLRRLLPKTLFNFAQDLFLFGRELRCHSVGMIPSRFSMCAKSSRRLWRSRSDDLLLRRRCNRVGQSQRATESNARGRVGGRGHQGVRIIQRSLGSGGI
jgi:hypothetical protein